MGVSFFRGVGKETAPGIPFGPYDTPSEWEVKGAG